MFKNLLLAAAATLALSGTAYAASHSECKPSKWGADDEIGAANYVTPERTLAATKLVKKGESHALGITIDSKTPAFPPRTLSLQVVQPGQHNGRSTAQDFGWHGSYNDDIAQLWFGIGSQLDGLGHLGEEGVYYNCNKAVDFVHITGLKKMGTHNVPPMVARGVLIDMAKHFGVETMASGQAIGRADLEAAMKAQGVTVNEGDVVIIHTGWNKMLEKDPKTWGSSEPGIDNDAGAYLASLNPMAVGADTWGVDVVPPKKGDKVFYAHVHFLKNNGIYILETMNTDRLAAEGVKEFMFVLGQARIRGTVQMIINPVAMW